MNSGCSGRKADVSLEWAFSYSGEGCNPRIALYLTADVPEDVLNAVAKWRSCAYLGYFWVISTLKSVMTDDRYRRSRLGQPFPTPARGPLETKYPKPASCGRERRLLWPIRFRRDNRGYLHVYYCWTNFGGHRASSSRPAWAWYSLFQLMAPRTVAENCRSELLRRFQFTYTNLLMGTELGTLWPQKVACRLPIDNAQGDCSKWLFAVCIHPQCASCMRLLAGMNR